MVNIIKDGLGFSFRVFMVEILFDPGHEVIFKAAFDDLVQDIGGDDLIEIGAGKIVGEQLSGCEQQAEMWHIG